jgi:glutathione S-transferase
MLTVHHLGRSQSERIVWLCEELGIEYRLKRYNRDPVTRLAPPELKALHPIGTAPIITDGDLVLGESGAIIEYIIAKYGGGRLALTPAHPDYPQYIYWFHYANGSFQALFHRYMIVRRLEAPPDNRTRIDMEGRIARALNMTNERLGATEYLAGKEFTAADIMIFFSLTTMRTFVSFDPAPYPNILSYNRRIGAREAYQRAMQKGDPEMAPLLA